MRIKLFIATLCISLCGVSVQPAQQPAQQAGNLPKRPMILGIAHVAFQVSDLNKAREFYGELLGYDEPFQIRNQDGTLALTYFKVNERQYIEIFPGLPPERDDRLRHIAFETNDLEALRVYLLSKGIKAPDKVNTGRDGNINFTIPDPDGHGVEFVQYRAGSLHTRAKGRYLSPRRISDRILHTGISVMNQAATDAFYKDVLGLSEIWRGGRDDTTLSWINMRVPDATDYVEYMLTETKPTRQQLGSMHHIALLVPDMQKALETLRERAGDAAQIRAPQVGRNRRWQLNLFDPDGTRTELMEPFPMR
ncbi:MAG: bleomycin resistance protein [Acidobacteria bacterium]|nr:bleomycin resistance protein [Acidobacteriota bacterium]